MLRGNQEYHSLDTEGIERKLLSIERSVHLDILPGETLLRTFLTTKFRLGVGRAPKAAEEGFYLGGNIYFTNYRIIFCRCIPSMINAFEDRYSTPKYFDRISIPLGSLLKSYINSNKSVTIETKDLRYVNIYFAELLHNLDEDAHDHTPQGFVDLIEQFCAQEALSKKEKIFAFQYISAFRSDGWRLNSVISEYRRLGLSGNDDPNWRVSIYVKSRVFPKQNLLYMFLSPLDR